LNESVRRVLRDKIVLGLFENPYVREDPIVIQKVASEGVDLSRRLAAESVTLLKNENNPLPLSRDVKKVAVIGPHADTVMVGFPQYTYPAALPMLRVAVKIGAFPMPGVGTVPPRGWEGWRPNSRARTPTWSNTRGRSMAPYRSPMLYASFCPPPR
jgi:beta-glucosidase